MLIAVVVLAVLLALAGGALVALLAEHHRLDQERGRLTEDVARAEGELAQARNDAAAANARADTAEAGQAEADAARADAEAGRIDAQTARDAAESARASADAARMAADAAREEAEARRDEGDAARDVAEAARQRADGERSDAADARDAATAACAEAEARLAEAVAARHRAEDERDRAEEARERAAEARERADEARARAEERLTGIAGGQLAGSTRPPETGQALPVTAAVGPTPPGTSPRSATASTTSGTTSSTTPSPTPSTGAMARAWPLLLSRLERHWAGVVGAMPDEIGIIDGPPSDQLVQALAREVERLREEAGVHAELTGDGPLDAADPTTLLLAAGEVLAVLARSSDGVRLRLGRPLVVEGTEWGGADGDLEALLALLARAGVGARPDVDGGQARLTLSIAAE